MRFFINKYVSHFLTFEIQNYFVFGTYMLYLSTSYFYFIHYLFTLCGKSYVYFCLTIKNAFNRIWFDVFQRHTEIMYEKEVLRSWKWHFSLRKDRDQKFMASEAEWVLPADAKYYRTEEQREEKYYQHDKGHETWPFFCRLIRWFLPKA